MSGISVELLADGRRIWSTAGFAMGPAMSEMHREMMGIPELGPASRLPVVVGDRRVGTAVLRVPQATVPAVDREFRASVNRLLLGGAIAAGVLALLIGLALARRTTTGVTELTAAANELATGRRDRRAAVSSKDEVGELATSFNAMADAVTREDELRTPLAILRSQLEAIQDRVTEPDPDVISSLHDETLRLGRLVADLETMADAGAAGFSLDRSELALRPLVRDVLDGLVGRLAERRGAALGAGGRSVMPVAHPRRSRRVGPMHGAACVPRGGHRRTPHRRAARPGGRGRPRWWPGAGPELPPLGGHRGAGEGQHRGQPTHRDQQQPAQRVTQRQLALPAAQPQPHLPAGQQRRQPVLVTVPQQRDHRQRGHHPGDIGQPDPQRGRERCRRAGQHRHPGQHRRAAGAGHPGEHPEQVGRAEAVRPGRARRGHRQVRLPPDEHGNSAEEHQSAADQEHHGVLLDE
ncbi:MAG: HAMP domain-containing protein [Pseudonocardiaceae bacterium]|nr:HAMP domain-containing protein [Pseudonocardiaceae bacterium]